MLEAWNHSFCKYNGDTRLANPQHEHMFSKEPSRRTRECECTQCSPLKHSKTMYVKWCTCPKELILFLTYYQLTNLSKNYIHTTFPQIYCSFTKMHWLYDMLCQHTVLHPSSLITILQAKNLYNWKKTKVNNLCKTRVLHFLLIICWYYS